MFIATPSTASKLISAIGTDFFWVDDVFITGVAAERAKVPLVDLRKQFTFKTDDVRCCVHGGGCEFLVAVSEGGWVLLEEYLRLTLTTAVNRKGRGDCRIAKD
jgi:hypothetical protein